MSVEDNKAGIVVGASVGGWEGIDPIIAHLNSLVFVPWEMVFQAGILAFIGGALGWLGSELMNQIKRLYKKYKNDKKSSG